MSSIQETSLVRCSLLSSFDIQPARGLFCLPLACYHVIMLLGAHVSIAGGVFNAPERAAAIGCEVFQMFTRSPQGGKVPELSPEIVKKFKAAMKEHGQKESYVHTPYFINFASANPRIKYGSAQVIRQELERSSTLGVKYCMTHLGSFKDVGQKEGMKVVKEGLAKALDGYKGSTQFLIEIAAGAGEIIGDTFEELEEIIDSKELKKYDIGICFDTQHAFASGYDLRTPEAIEETLNSFDNIIGLERMKMSHCNDSKIEFGGKRDRHEHIGEGHIGKEAFKILVNHPKIQHVNFILETKHDKVEQDLKLLKKLRRS